MTAAPAPSPWSPLAQPDFRTLWLAILVGNIGTWVHDVAAAWTMAGLTQSPLWVAAVQSATTLPIALLALVAGTLADIVDRRRYLIAVQVFMLLVAAGLSVLAALGMLGPPLLLALTFALGCGAALGMPAQAAITPELVPREQLAPAVALHSVGVNVARSIGPALGGLVVAALGAAWAFGLNALSFVALVAALRWWRRPAAATTLPPEGFGLALRAGLRYARHAGPLRAVLAKAACFFVFAAAPTALLPLVVRDRLGAGPGTFGLLLGSVGAGALLGALLLPRLRQRLERDTMVLAASLLLAATMLGLAGLRQPWALSMVMLGNGLAWIIVLSSLQIAAQSAVPGWVRARAMALYLVVFSLGMAAGSLLWGTVAQRSGLPAALVAAALALMAAALFARRFRLAGIETLEHTASGHWPPPQAREDTGGPVMVTVEYRIDATGRELFIALMHELGERRRRDGAVQWGLVEDAAAPGEFLEWFLVGSWLEHRRQHERVTREEERLQAALARLHRSAAPPRVRHFAGAGAAPPTHAGDAVVDTAAVALNPSSGGNTMTNPSLFTTKDGTTLYFKDWGDRAGAVVVLCHGWPLSSDSWESQMLLLAENGYRVIAHDRRGHGRSSQPWHGNEMDTYADDLAELLEHLDVRDISIFGFSTGGGEVARYIGRHGTGRVKKAGLISAVPPLMLRTAANPGGLPVEVFDGIRNGQLADRSQLYRDIPSGPFYGYNRPGATPSQGIIDAWWLQGMMGGHRNTFECIRAFSETDFTEDLKKFDVPTLILHGDDDQIVPIGAAALASAKLVRDNTLIIYEGAPHGLTDTHKARFNADLLAFLRR